MKAIEILRSHQQSMERGVDRTRQQLCDAQAEVMMYREQLEILEESLNSVARAIRILEERP